MENSGATSGSSPSANPGPSPPPAAVSTTTTAGSNDLIPSEIISPAPEASDGSRPHVVSSPRDTIDLPVAHSAISSGHDGHALIANETIETIPNNTLANNTAGVVEAPNNPNPSHTNSTDLSDGAGAGTGTGTGAEAGTGTGSSGSGAQMVENDTYEPAPQANTSVPRAIISTDTVLLP